MKAALVIIAFAFTASGVLHLVNPEAFLWLLPSGLPGAIFLIHLSGVIELVSAGGLMFRKRWAGLLAALTLLAVWPANIWFAFSVLQSADPGLIWAAWLRLPLQVPLIYFAWKYSSYRIFGLSPSGTSTRQLGSRF